MEMGFFKTSMSTGTQTSNIPEMFSYGSLDNPIIITDDTQTVQDEDLRLSPTASAIISYTPMDYSDVEIVEDTQSYYTSTKRQRESQEEIPESSSKKKCMREYRPKEVELEDQNLASVDFESSDETDEDLMYFKSLLPHFKTLSHTSKMRLKLNIQDMLYREVCAKEAENFTLINRWLPNQNGPPSNTTYLPHY